MNADLDDLMVYADKYSVCSHSYRLLRVLAEVKLVVAHRAASS